MKEKKIKQNCIYLGIYSLSKLDKLEKDIKKLLSKRDLKHRKPTEKGAKN